MKTDSELTCKNFQAKILKELQLYSKHSKVETEDI